VLTFVFVCFSVSFVFVGVVVGWVLSWWVGVGVGGVRVRRLLPLLFQGVGGWLGVM
jgi:hypothetical protein